MIMNVTPEQAKAAAQWWAEQVCHPTFSALSDDERKSQDSLPTFFAEMMAWVSTQPVSPEQKRAFAEALETAIIKEDQHILHVDYGADPTLTEAAKKAGISHRNFPWKTTMWIEDSGAIWVRLGYGAPRTIIYPKMTQEEIDAHLLTM